MNPALALPRIRLIRLRDFALIPAIIAIMVVGSWVSPVFLHRDNLTNILQQQSEISLLVLAEALVLLCGRMDLSLESTFGLSPASPPGWCCRPGSRMGWAGCPAAGRSRSRWPPARSSGPSTGC